MEIYAKNKKKSSKTFISRSWFILPTLCSSLEKGKGILTFVPIWLFKLKLITKTV